MKGQSHEIGISFFFFHQIASSDVLWEVKGTKEESISNLKICTKIWNNCNTSWVPLIMRQGKRIFLWGDCLMRIKVGIAICQSKALFKSYCHPPYNFNFILRDTLKFTLKKFQLINGSTIQDRLDDSRCGSFLCLCSSRLCQNLHG